MKKGGVTFYEISARGWKRWRSLL